MFIQCLLLVLVIMVGGLNTVHAEESLAVSIKRLSMEAAFKIAQDAIAECRKKGIQAAVSVVDRGGHEQVMLRDTLAVDLATRLAYEKAYTALSFNVPTSQLTGRATSPLGNRDGLLMLGGGLPIEVGGIIYGAVGVSGAQTSDDDHDCAKAGIKAIKDDLEMN